MYTALPCLSLHGDNCYFAHSKEELQLWNEEISSTLSDYINVQASCFNGTKALNSLHWIGHSS